MQTDFGEISLSLKKAFLNLMGQLENQLFLEKRGAGWFKFNVFVQEKEFNKLVELGALEVKPYLTSDEYGLDQVRLVKIKKERFSELYKGLTKSFQNQGTNTSSILYLDDNGNLWHGEKSKFCYSMEADSNRLKILSYLVDNVGFQPTKEIAEHCGKSIKMISSEIGKIRKNISKFLEIDGKEIIKSKSTSGYRINPSYKIIRE